MTEPIRFIVEGTIGRRGGSGDLPGLLDMLRYDRATVEAWDLASNERDSMTLTLTLSADRVTVDRWRSFGLVPVTDTVPRQPIVTR